jgi:hypothetical protein
LQLNKLLLLLLSSGNYHVQKSLPGIPVMNQKHPIENSLLGLLTFIIHVHQVWCSHLKWALAKRTRAGALQPFKFSVHSSRGLEL